MSLIYLADDEADILDIVGSAIESEGHTVETFEEGTSLLDRVQEQPPDLVLLDINMPGPSGWEVRRELRKDPGSADVPVVAVTARGGDGVKGSAEDALGFADFIRKPFRLADLLDRVEAVLEDPPAGEAP